MFQNNFDIFSLSDFTSISIFPFSISLSIPLSVSLSLSLCLFGELELTCMSTVLLLHT